MGGLDRDKGNGKRRLYQKSKARNMSESSRDHHAMLKGPSDPQFPAHGAQTSQTHPLFCFFLSSLLLPRHSLLSTPTHPPFLPCQDPQLQGPPSIRPAYRTDRGGLLAGLHLGAISLHH